MPIGRCEITAQRGNTFHGARLGQHVALCPCARHALLQSTIYSRYGQAGQQVLAYLLVVLCNCIVTVRFRRLSDSP